MIEVQDLYTNILCFAHTNSAEVSEQIEPGSHSQFASLHVGIHLLATLMSLTPALRMNIPVLKQARGGRWNLGILRVGSVRTNNPILGAKLPIVPHIPPESPLKIPDSSVPFSPFYGFS
jgi:hypothetical protein